MTSIAKIARITNLPRIKTQQKKKPRRTPKCPQYRKNRKYNKDFSCELKTPMTNIAKIAK